MKNVLNALANARTVVKAKAHKKDGRNTFSNYDYFTPELVSNLTTEACIEANLLCVFNLRKDELGYFGELTTTELESGEVLITVMRTEKPSIKATNETQQMGGMNTYTKRYMLMSLFDIEENSADFDSDEYQKKVKATPPAAVQTDEPEKPWLNKTDKAGAITDTWAKVVKSLQGGGFTLAQVEGKYKISKSNKAELQTLMP